MNNALIEELEKYLELPPAEARRTAFLILAHHRGWPKAQIARYMGISRARVGQRIDRLRAHTDKDRLGPIASDLLRGQPVAATGITTPFLGFEADRWEDRAFADRMLEMVAA
jgi:hypothetical protein